MHLEAQQSLQEEGCVVDINGARDDQVSTPHLTPEEELERRAANIASKLTIKDHLMNNVLGSLRKGVNCHTLIFMPQH